MTHLPTSGLGTLRFSGLFGTVAACRCCRLPNMPGQGLGFWNGLRSLKKVWLCGPACLDMSWLGPKNAGLVTGLGAPCMAEAQTQIAARFAISFSRKTHLSGICHICTKHSRRRYATTARERGVQEGVG